MHHPRMLWAASCFVGQARPSASFNALWDRPVFVPEEHTCRAKGPTSFHLFLCLSFFFLLSSYFDMGLENIALSVICLRP